MDFANGFENHVPVWSTEICGCAETGDGVLFGVCVVDHDVCCVVGFDLCGEVLEGLLDRVEKIVLENILCGSRCGHPHLEPLWQEAMI